MSDDLDRKTLNALVVATHKAIVATFDEGDWRSLGFQTDTLKEIEWHPRLLRGARWKTNEDYPGFPAAPGLRSPSPFRIPGATW
jgi:hypothetical protein